MKTGLFGQQLTLMEELKAATFPAHSRLQTAPFFPALVACQLPLESYVGQLRAFAAIHGVLEQALESCSDERVASVWSPDMRKLPLLHQDLRYFEPRSVADLKDAVGVALETADRIRLRSMEKPLSLLGCVYVLEGSTLGALTLRRLYARAFLLTGEEGLSFIHCYGSKVHARWVQYQQRMNALYVTEEERKQIIEAANELFAQLEAVFRALYPFQPESKAFLVNSINPEAGRHPVPSDERELKAALRAADLCWEQFPYFEHRYGERGRLFARSDAAWKATLHQYAPDQILQQVQWLGRVLATRGMPTVLLQVQLENLYEALSAAIPEKRSSYEKLLDAARELHRARCRHLADDQIQTLAAKFDETVGPEWSKKFPHTGILLASAVADELEGITGTVENLRHWMTDPDRFPAEWISAVQSTLAQAQEQARDTGENTKHP